LVAGVLGPGGWILETSFARARRGLCGLAPEPARDVERRQFRDRFDVSIAEAAGWLDWAIDYRDMLVHCSR
jgi:hypothetical protein